MHMSGPLWLVDLDNTLYDASWRVMGEINRRMTRYVGERLGLPPEEASRLRERYWHRYGATLLGLVRHHRVCPHDFLAKTHPGHELPDFVRRIRGERQRLACLRGEKWLFTNAPRAYALHILKIMGVEKLFDRIITIEDMQICGQLRPKPSPWILRHIIRLSGRRPGHIALIDDHNENLRSAHKMGMKTARIWASPTALSRARHSGRPLTVRRPSYVHLQVHSLYALARRQYQWSRF